MMKRDNRILPAMMAIATLLHIANGTLLVDEDKRQGLIPFPRVGRTLLNYFQYPFASTGELMEPLQEPYLAQPDVFVRYSRSDRAFTPRLGRRKRSISEDDDSSYNLNGKIFQLEQLLRKSPWTIVTFKGIDKKMAFSPRLGRAMVPRLGKKSDEEVDKRAAAFAPRLGRGNMLIDDEETFNVDTRAAFSPRLGRANIGGKVNGAIQSRASAFAPRLGRSDSDLSTNEQAQQPQQQQN